MQERQKENQAQVEFKQEESIFSYYSIENEVDFLRKLDNLPPAEQSLYIRESMYSFLGEFAGKIPYKRLPYVIKDNRFTFAGIDVMDLYQNTSVLAGAGSREWYETQGMMRVEDSFINDTAYSATALSPPKNADYAFVFHFEGGGFDAKLGSRRIDQYIIRYDEKRGQLATTEKIASAIDDKHAQEYQTTEDYLSIPFVSLDSNLEKILSTVGVSLSDIEYSQCYEKAIRRELSPWVERYVEGVDILAFGDINKLDRKIITKDIKKLVTALFNKAQAIARDLKYGHRSIQGHCPNKQSVIVHDAYYMQQELSYYLQQEALVVGGGSCPVTKQQKQFGLAFVFDGMVKGNTIREIMESEGTTWKYHKGDCINCPAEDVDVGPCSICKKCEKIL